MKIDAQEILNACRLASDLRDEGEYQKALKACDDILEKYPSAHKAVRDIHYMKAIILDVSGKANEALPIITELVGRFPMNPHYRKSLRIIVKSCHAMAFRIKVEDATSPLLRNFWNLMREFHSPALWLTEAVAMLDIAEGKALEAKEKMRDLLELPPRDSNYLVASMRVAEALKDDSWLCALRKQAAIVASERPDLVELCYFQDITAALPLTGNS